MDVIRCPSILDKIVETFLLFFQIKNVLHEVNPITVGTHFIGYLYFILINILLVGAGEGGINSSLFLFKVIGPKV